MCCQHITYCDWVETFDEFLALEFAQDFFHSVKVKVTLGSDLPGPYALRTTLLYDLIYNLKHKHKHKPSLMDITVSLLKQYYTLISIWCLWYKFSIGEYFNYCISRLLFKSLHYSNYIFENNIIIPQITCRGPHWKQILLYTLCIIADNTRHILPHMHFTTYGLSV